MGKKDKTKAIIGRLLTKSLRELAVDIIEIDPSVDGKATTRAEKLAQVLWDHALGYTEHRRAEEGANMVEIVHKPAPWAITLLYDRLEGKVAPTNDPGVERPSLGDKLKATGARRINKI